MRLVIVTGMSGAGKTAALKMLEDMGFYCVDNLPIPLVGKFAELVQSSSGEVSCAALGIDVRSGDELAQLEGTLNDWNNIQFPYEILFLDASDEVLIKRYKETRRSQPRYCERAPETRFPEKAGGLYSGHQHASDAGAQGGTGTDFHGARALFQPLCDDLKLWL
mgnify:CR=1 FL=1